MKHLIFSFLFLIPELIQAQTINDHVLAFQSEIRPVNSPYHVHSVMFGMKTINGDQYLIGPAIKTFINNVGHRKSYAGLKIHTHIMIGRFAPFLSYEMMWGEYFIYGAEATTIAFIRSGKQGKGVLGLGYAITDQVGIFAGVSGQDYDPVRFYKTKKTPYTTRSMTVKLNANVWTLFSN